jgi:hypothetical protein
MPPPGQDSLINTYSAKSGDGIHYTFEPGPRVDHPSRRLIDPSVIWFNSSWHYESPKGVPQEGAFHYLSPDGIHFTQVPYIPSDPMHNWTGNYMVNAPGELRFYGTGVFNIWFKSSPNGGTWSPYVNTNITGGDPTVVRISQDSYLMIYTGPQYPPAGLNTIDPSENMIRVYPNPSRGLLFIRIPGSCQGPVHYIICDLLGNTVMRGRLSEKISEINISNLTPGGYILTLHEELSGSYFIVKK